MNMLPTKTYDWVKGHPLTATVAAVVAAAYSLTLYKNEEQELQQPLGIDSKKRLSRDVLQEKSISWGDQHGESLTEVINLSDEDYSAGGSDILLKELDSSLPDMQEGNAMQRFLKKKKSCAEVNQFFTGSKANKPAENDFDLDESTSSDHSSSESISDMAHASSQFLRNKQKKWKAAEGETNSPNSPQWGWYVSFTPPQRQQYPR